MSKGEITRELESFIGENINSIEQLEILLLMHAQQDRSWSPAELADALYIQPQSAARRLADLHVKGFCYKPDKAVRRFVYRTTQPLLDRLVQELADAYQIRHTAVISLVFASPHPDRPGGPHRN